MRYTRRFGLGLALLGLTAATYYFWPRADVSGPAGASAGQPATERPGPPAPQPAPIPTASYNPADFPLAAHLNAPDSTISRDLDLLQQILDNWRSNFPREGNPVGENQEITAALAGENRLRFALLPKAHPAINARGELCDRWGTPFRFHQLSGERMEVRSAGPDHKFATEDDAVWTPN
jgi:hypothetical protein